MHILLLRHGDALETADDASRELSSKGIRQARIAGAILKALSLAPDVIFVSPLVRAQQTARIVGDALSVGNIITTEHLTSGSDPREIFREINDKRMTAVLLVGHEPHLSVTTSLLTSGNRASHLEFSKGSLAFCESIDPVGSGSGVLRWMLPPDVSAKLLGI